MDNYLDIDPANSITKEYYWNPAWKRNDENAKDLPNKQFIIYRDTFEALEANNLCYIDSPSIFYREPNNPDLNFKMIVCDWYQEKNRYYEYTENPQTGSEIDENKHCYVFTCGGYISDSNINPSMYEDTKFYMSEASKYRISELKQKISMGEEILCNMPGSIWMKQVHQINVTSGDNAGKYPVPGGLNVSLLKAIMINGRTWATTCAVGAYIKYFEAITTNTSNTPKENYPVRYYDHGVILASPSYELAEKDPDNPWVENAVVTRGELRLDYLGVYVRHFSITMGQDQASILINSYSDQGSPSLDLLRPMPFKLITKKLGPKSYVHMMFDDSESLTSAMADMLVVSSTTEQGIRLSRSNKSLERTFNLTLMIVLDD